MKYDELATKIENGDYNSKLPYPPYQKERTEEQKAEERSMKDAWRQDKYRLKGVFSADLKKYAEAELGKTITDEQHSTIFAKAWEDGHSSGYSEILIYADDIIGVVKKFV